MAASPLELYDVGLRGGAPLLLRYDDGRADVLPVAHYLAELSPGDGGLLARCCGPTLDVGCGPGRLTVALGRRGHRVLGVDVADGAVALARERGALVLVRSVFDRLPGSGRWGTALLADGNIGIGGDPGELLARLRALLAPDGRVLVELAPAGIRSGPVRARLECGGRTSAWFGWAHVAGEGIAVVAAAAGLQVVERWEEAGRHFAALAGAQPAPNASSLPSPAPMTSVPSASSAG